MRIVLAQDLGERHYDEIADQVSMNARHLLWFLLEVAKDGEEVHLAKLRARIRSSGHGWTPAQVQTFLQELATAHCVTFVGTRQAGALDR
jgi:hypothetical protein